MDIYYICSEISHRSYFKRKFLIWGGDKDMVVTC